MVIFQQCIRTYLIIIITTHLSIIVANSLFRHTDLELLYNNAIAIMADLPITNLPAAINRKASKPVL